MLSHVVPNHDGLCYELNVNDVAVMLFDVDLVSPYSRLARDDVDKLML